MTLAPKRQSSRGCLSAICLASSAVWGLSALVLLAVVVVNLVIGTESDEFHPAIILPGLAIGVAAAAISVWVGMKLRR